MEAWEVLFLMKTLFVIETKFYEKLCFLVTWYVCAERQLLSDLEPRARGHLRHLLASVQVVPENTFTACFGDASHKTIMLREDEPGPHTSWIRNFSLSVTRTDSRHHLYLVSLSLLDCTYSLRGCVQYFPMADVVIVRHVCRY